MAFALAALAVEPVPAPAPQPPTEATVAPPPRALTADERQRLQDFRFKTLAVEATPESFRVRDGMGATVGLTSFAKTTNDTDTLAQLARDRNRAANHQRALAYSGVGLIAASAVTLVAGLPNKSSTQREDVAYTAVFLGLSGGLLWWISPMAAKAKQSPPIDDYYTRAQAESRAESYNEALRARLGIDAIPPAPVESP